MANNVRQCAWAYNAKVSIPRVSGYGGSGGKTLAQGMNYICQNMKNDSLGRFDSTKSLYYDGEGLDIGIGGNTLNFANWDTCAWWLCGHFFPNHDTADNGGDVWYDYYMGIDGVPDTLSRLSLIFSDMNQLDQYLVQSPAV